MQRIDAQNTLPHKGAVDLAVKFGKRVFQRQQESAGHKEIAYTQTHHVQLVKPHMMQDYQQHKKDAPACDCLYHLFTVLRCRLMYWVNGRVNRRFTSQESGNSISSTNHGSWW